MEDGLGLAQCGSFQPGGHVEVDHEHGHQEEHLVNGNPHVEHQDAQT